MMILIAAAAVAAAQPATPAPSAPMAQSMTQHSGPKSEDCCKDCCKDMAAKQEGHAEHKGHTGQ